MIGTVTAEPSDLDMLFRDAVAAIDAGDVAVLERMLDAHPRLVRDRLDAPGPWLREKVGSALDGFFRRPYLLWFVAEDPVRAGTLPANVAEIARAVVDAARSASVETLREQLDYALRLVAWSTVARERGVQLELIDVLVDAGASLGGCADDALVNGNVGAAEHLLARGAASSLATALCLGRWDDASRLAPAASAAARQFALVLAALNGRADGVRAALALGADPNAPSAHLFAHGTPLHHAVCSGSLETVAVLADAGADLHARDTAWNGTPLGWAEHYSSERRDDARGPRYAAIADWLRGMGAAK